MKPFLGDNHTVKKTTIRIDGIYSNELLTKLKAQGETEFSFDFRARSLNFLQQYKFLECIKGNISNGDKLFLHYSNEQDYIIQKMLDDLKVESPEYSSQIYLYFSDVKEKEFYESFEKPFSWEFDNIRHLEKIVDSKYFNELVIPFSLIQWHHGKGDSIPMLTKIFNLRNKHKFNISIKINWDFSIIESVFDFFHFDSYIIPVSHYVETSYRNIDLQKIDNQIDIIKNQLTISP